MLDIKKMFTKILNALPLFVEVNLSGTAPALSANTYFNMQLTGTIPSGYKPVAIKSVNTGTSNYYIHSITLNNSDMYIAGRSHNGQSTTASASAVVLCMKTLGGGVFHKPLYVNRRKVVGVC